MSDLFLVLILIVALCYRGYREREFLRQLSCIQKVQMASGLVFATLLCFAIVYYGGNKGAQLVDNGFLRFLIRLTSLLVGFYLASYLISKVFKRLPKPE